MPSNPLMENAGELGTARRTTSCENRRRLHPAIVAASGFLLLLLLAVGFALGFVYAVPTAETSSNSQSEVSQAVRRAGGSSRLLLAQTGPQRQPQLSSRAGVHFAEFALDTDWSSSNCSSAAGTAVSNNFNYPCWFGRHYLAVNDLGPLRQLDGDARSFVLTEDRRQVRLLLDGVFAVDAQVRVRIEEGNLALQGHLRVNGSPSKVFCDERIRAPPSGNSLMMNALTITCRLSGFAKLQSGDLLTVWLELFKAKPVLSAVESTFIRLVRLG